MNSIYFFILMAIFLPMLIYLYYCIRLYCQQTRLLYNPRPDTLNNNHQQLFLHLPHRGWQVRKQHSNALIYFGGKGELIETRLKQLKKWFPSHAVYLIPYRGYGPNHHMIPSEAVLKSDAVALYDAIVKQHACIDVIGRSMGTGIALFLAACRPIRKLSLITPYYSISQLAQQRYPWIPVRFLLKDKFDARKHAPLLTVPTLAVISLTDHIIPIDQWNKLKLLINIPLEEYFTSEGHDLMLESEILWERLAVFFHAHQRFD